MNKILLKRALTLCIIALTLLTSCKKGDAGAVGDKGDKGDTGAIGATGADGTKIYSGITIPDPSIGKTGDFYLNLNNGNFYGPKTANWGTATNLKGANGTNGTNGATGAAGSKIYSGNTTPAVNLGVNGDYYLNTTSYLFYGPKTSGTWPAPINMKGPKGDPGTANVIYSDWFTPTTYTNTVIFDINTLAYDKAEPKITADILNKGVILVYAKLNGYTSSLGLVDKPVQLPYQLTYTVGGTVYTDTWSFITSVGNIRISFVNDKNFYTAINNIHQFRYVIIPGGVSVLGNTDIRNYDKVKELLQLRN
ncbi:hypothetical protein [Pedobacter foliorum]|uniref:hypothetical protein n=1 Tax=Pedobacter foliorum TaxID=2739058 RepID=UPI001564E01A|nr:hypothetical protein [Pedobacter foliorum]NRF39296.1 hypothetical protein [Pedobacter foliorum]